MATNYRAMQVAGTAKTPASKPQPGIQGVKTRYLAGGSWRASLSAGGNKRAK